MIDDNLSHFQSDDMWLYLPTRQHYVFLDGQSYLYAALFQKHLNDLYLVERFEAVRIAYDQFQVACRFAESELPEAAHEMVERYQNLHKTKSVPRSLADV